MKRGYTHEQKMRALKKLARSYGEWNRFPDASDKGRRHMNLHTAVWAVIKKFDLVGVYESPRRRKP